MENKMGNTIENLMLEEVFTDIPEFQTLVERVMWNEDKVEFWYEIMPEIRKIVDKMVGYGAKLEKFQTREYYEVCMSFLKEMSPTK